MDEKTFWELIDTSREEVGGDPDEQIRALRTALTGRSRSDIEQFAKIYRTLHWEAYHLGLFEHRLHPCARHE